MISMCDEILTGKGLSRNYLRIGSLLSLGDISRIKSTYFLN